MSKKTFPVLAVAVVVAIALVGALASIAAPTRMDHLHRAAFSFGALDGC